MTAAVVDFRAEVFRREKRLATLTALCCLRGVVLQASQDDHGRDSYLLSRGELTLELPSLDAVEAWLAEAGA